MIFKAMNPIPPISVTYDGSGPKFADGCPSQKVVQRLVDNAVFRLNYVKYPILIRLRQGDAASCRTILETAGEEDEELEEEVDPSSYRIEVVDE